MTFKKVWFLAIVFGVLSTACFYFFLIPSVESKKSLPAETVVLAAEEENEEITENDTESLLEIENGKRAMSFALNDVQGMAGFLQPGSMIDIYANYHPAGEELTSEVGTYVLQNIKVLAVGHYADDTETKSRYQMITVEVSPEDGAKLGFATQHSLHIMLRSDGDDSTINHNLIDKNMMLKQGGQ